MQGRDCTGRCRSRAGGQLGVAVGRYYDPTTVDTSLRQVARPKQGAPKHLDPSRATPHANGSRRTKSRSFIGLSSHPKSNAPTRKTMSS